MSFNLLDTVKGLFTPNLISTAASSPGESGIQNALSGTIPAILAGLVSKAYSNEGTSNLFDLAKQAAGYGSSFAVYAADAPETDRVKDRHVSVSVR
jgi:Bacterial protein of unknown function (DUF937)